MSEALYNTAILRLAASIPHGARLAAAPGSAMRVSPICGSRVIADVALGADGRVAAFGQEVRACALGQASAAILGAGVIGRLPAELAQAREALARFLRDPAAPPPPGFADAALLAPARAHKARHASILLAFEAAAAAAAAAKAAAMGPQTEAA